jgi:hypothetical protein
MPCQRCRTGLSPLRSSEPFGPSRFNGREKRMAFQFRLEHDDGSPADPPTLKAAVPNWRAGDTIPVGGKALRVIDVRSPESQTESRC